jgi:hypothetical protein
MPSEGEKKLLNQAEYARHKGVSREAIRKAILSGRITQTVLESGVKGIDPELADKQWADNTFIGNVRSKDGDAIIASENATSDEAKKAEVSGPSYADSRAKREKLAAEMLEMELEIKAKRLVRADEVEHQAFEDGRKIRNSIMSLPDRLAPLLASETDVSKIHTILLREFSSTLKGLSRELRDER